MNRDEALRCVELANLAAAEKNLPRAIRLYEKALGMYQSAEIEKMLNDAKRQFEKENQTNHHKPAPSNNSNSNSNNNAESEVRKRNTAQQSETAAKTQSNSSSTGSPSPPHTPAMKEAVSRVIIAKTHYEVLEVTKEADENTVKKAYRRLALVLHPDKNSAPRADEAFKKLSDAFNCLSDPARKATYDEFGTDNPHEMRQQYHGGGGGGGRYRDPTPEELFEQFFGGMFGGNGHVFVNGRNVRYRHNPFFNGYARDAGYTEGDGRRARNHEQPGLLQQLMQLLPLILVFTFMFLGNGSSDYHATKVYSFQQSGQHVAKMSTGLVDYYVAKDFQFPTSKQAFNYEVNKEWKRNLFYRCQAELEHRERQIYRARNAVRPSTKGIRDAEATATPTCDEYTAFTSKFSQ